MRDPWLTWLLVATAFLAGMRFTGHRWFCRLGWHRRMLTMGDDRTYTDWCILCGKVFKKGIKSVR